MLQLDELIGRGAFGTVYRGRMHSPDGLVRRVAVKLLSPEMSADARAVSRFRDEARLLALVDHPGLVPVYSLAQLDDRWAVVMGFVDGFQLFDALQHGPLPPAAVRDIGAQAASTLAALWESRHPETFEPLRVVHRDIKPHNLMIDRNGVVRLLDLGVARARFETRETQTQLGEMAGTLAYMSPQRLSRQDDAHAGDLYALGATMYQLLTHELLPASGVEPASHQQMLDELGEGPLLDCIRTALAYAPGDRPTARQFAEALRALESLEGADLHTWSTGMVARWGPRAGSQPADGGASDVLGTHELAQSEATIILDLDDASVIEEIEERDEVPPSRRRWLMGSVTVLLLGALLVAGLRWRAPTGPPVTLMMTPTVDNQTLLAEHELIRRYLQRRLGRPIRFVVGDSYEDVSDRLISGEVPFAQMPHRVGTYTLERDPSIRRLATKVVDGSSTVDGYVVVRRTDAIQDVKELAGSTFCYSDPLSNTGYKLPRVYLKAQGLDPDRDLVGRVSGNHEQVLRDVVEGVCRAGGTFSHNLNTADQRGISIAQLRILGITGQIPHDAWYASPTADPGLAKAFREALLDLDPQRDFGTATVGESERISGYVVAP